MWMQLYDSDRDCYFASRDRSVLVIIVLVAVLHAKLGILQFD